MTDSQILVFVWIRRRLHQVGFGNHPGHPRYEGHGRDGRIRLAIQLIARALA